MATQRCGAPSTPRTEVPQGTALSKSVSQGAEVNGASGVQPCARCEFSFLRALAEEATRRSTGEASGQFGGRVGRAGTTADGVADGENDGEATALARRGFACLNRGV
eukprot:2905962-Pleurochrysis_carterae.AAC.1